MQTRRTDRRTNKAARGWFQCIHCGNPVGEQAQGTDHRNHCPICLWSKHLDNTPGDRASECGGVMEPVAVWVRPGGDWALIHRCRRCGDLHSNRIAGDDSELMLLSIAIRPVAEPAFPMERAVAGMVRGDVEKTG
ncbi:MAG TPA: RNHCP domain-containing protein [Capsulimonadaceae bacterium]